MGTAGDGARPKGRAMHRIRLLTPGEVALCRDIFPDDLPYSDVRLVEGAAVNDIAEIAFRKGNGAITLRRTIYFKHHYCPDFAAADTDRRALFVHEMTHVWQWCRLGVPLFLLLYGRDLIACRGDARAMYRYEQDAPDLPFARSRLEAQAEMVGDLQHPAHPRRALIEAKMKGTDLYGL